MVQYFSRSTCTGIGHGWPLVAFLLPFVAACGSNLHTQAPNITPDSPAQAIVAPAPPPVVQTPVVDPVLALIAASDGNFKAGERELELGHAEAARLGVDLASDTPLLH